MTKNQDNSSSSESEAESKPRRTASRDKSSKANTSDNDEPSKSKSAKNARKRAEKEHASESESRGTIIDKIAKLHVPANKIKKHMLAYWKVKGGKPPSLRDQIHVYMASIVEDTTLLVVNSSIVHSKKNSLGVYTITDTNICTAVNTNDALTNLFLIALRKYDPDTDYMTSSILTGDELSYILTSLDNEHQFGERGQNLMCYLINSFFNSLMKVLRANKDNMMPKGVSLQARMFNAVLVGHMNSTELKPMRKAAMARLARVEEYKAQNREEAEATKKKDDSEDSDDIEDDEDDDKKKSSKSSKSNDKKKRQVVVSKSKKAEASEEKSDDDNPVSKTKGKKTKRVEESEDDEEKNSAADDDESDDEKPKKIATKKKSSSSS